MRAFIVDRLVFADRIPLARILGAGLACALVACAPDTPSYTQFPVPVDLARTGGIVTMANIGPLENVLVTIDTMSPLTTVDTAILGDNPPPMQRYVEEVELLDPGGSGARYTAFREVAILETPACVRAADAMVDEYCSLGMEGRQEPIRGIVGADLLSKNAVRFDVGQGELRFFSDISGTSGERSALCDVVFDKPFAGGGTLIIGQGDGSDGTEVSFTASRIAVDVCFYNDACTDETQGSVCTRHCPVPQPRDTAYGVDALFVVSTALPVSLVTRTTYERYVYMHEERPLGMTPTPYEMLQTNTLYLPSGPVEVRMARMNHLALVADASDERGPCGERYLNDYLTRNETCSGSDRDEGVCQCPENQQFCRVAGLAQVAKPRSTSVHQGFEVAVVPDEDPTLQALRNELRPELPEVSGILGMNVFDDLIMDVDYPNDRAFLRCATGVADQHCVVRPWVLSNELLDETVRCLPEDMTTEDASCLPLP